MHSLTDRDTAVKKILIITYYWPPAGGPGVQRWLKFSKYLPEFGYDPIIITVDPETVSYTHLIGRPSTYAPTITTIQNRGYILRESREGTERQLDQIDLKGEEIKVKKINRIFGAEKKKDVYKRQV